MSVTVETAASETRTAPLAERFNLAADSRTFDCKFIEPGIISYLDHDGGGIELLDRETLDRCIQSAVGNPVTIGHVRVNAENRMEVEQGVIQEVYFDSADGWFHAKGTVDTPRAQRLMTVKKPSCGYAVREFGPGGTHHGIRYDKRLKEIVFNHLAIVDQPRYEEATFRLNSLFNPTTMNLFTLLKRIVTRENGTDGKPIETVKDELTQLPGDTQVSFTVGDKEHKMRLNELGEVWLKQSAPAPAPEELTVEGTKVKVADLVAGFRANEAAKAAETKRVAEEAAAKTAAEDKAKRENAAAFNLLQSARSGGAAPTDYSATADSLQDKLARGRARY
ncbi:MAG: DUF2213 domain-containing protein [Chloroflexota bacterium]|nr:DUF2213 domain-containing protein [Chloroflexota bacterium]